MTESRQRPHVSIRQQLLRQVVLVSFVLILLLTAIMAISEYRSYVASVHKQMDELQRTQTRGISVALWGFDKQTMEAQLTGITHLPYIRYVAIRGKDGFLLESGKKIAGDAIERETVLTWKYNGHELVLGSLYIQADTSQFFQDLMHKVVVIFLFQTTVVASISLLIFQLFNRLVTRHLARAADYFHSFDLNGEPLQFDKKPSHDELDVLVDSFNTMQEKLSRSYRQLSEREQSMRESEQRLLLATSSARLGVWDWNLKDNTMIWDDRMLALYGYTRQNFPGGIEAWECGMHPEDRVEAMESCQAALRGEKEFDAEFRVLHPDGTMKWLRANGIVIREQDGTPIRMLGINRDITQRKTNEASLRASEARMVTAIEIAGLYLYEGSGPDVSQLRILFSDDRTREFLGIPPDQEYRTQDYWIEHIHQDDLRNIVIPAISRLEKKGENLVSAEYRYYNEQRGWLWFRHVAYAVNRDDKGNVTRLVGAFQDISEQQRIIEETRQNEARLASLLRISQYQYSSIQDLLDFALSESISLTESKIGYIYYYDETLRQFTLNTWSKDVMKECSILDTNSTYELADTGLWGEVVRQRRPIIVNDFQAENPLKKGYPEGHAPLHSFMTIPVFSRDSIVAVVGVANKIKAYENADIQQLSLMMDAVWRMVEQERSDRAVLASETKYRTLLESIELIAVILDTDGTIVFCNDYLLNLTGWTGDEVLGKNWFDLFLPAEIRGEVSKIFREMLGSTLRSHYQNQIICKDGKARTIFWNNTLLHDADGTITGVASIGNDLTEKLATEDQLRQAQKMEGIGQLAGGIAHDFNNILTVIGGYCALLKMGGGLSEEQKQGVEAITASAERAAQLTHGLLAFSRKQPLVMKRENLNDIVQNVHKFLARIIGEDIKLYTTCSGEELPVNADKGQIEQVLINLATNARDAMPRGGTFSVKTDLTNLDNPSLVAQDISLPPGRYAVVTVSDTGTGIIKEHLGQIFEPFFTTKEVGKGTGLGMAIIYGIVKQHNGFINVYSESGVGTTFRVYLPIDDKQDNTYVEHTAIAPPERGIETILVAEDEPAVRSLVEKVLSKHGYTVILAEDGMDAIDKFIAYQDKISLILMDMIMPKKNGKEAYEEICRIHPGIKVLFSSGYTADFIENRGISGEAVELITKPVQPMELLRKVRQMLDV